MLQIWKQLRLVILPAQDSDIGKDRGQLLLSGRSEAVEKLLLGWINGRAQEIQAPGRIMKLRTWKSEAQNETPWIVGWADHSLLNLEFDVKGSWRLKGVPQTDTSSLCFCHGFHHRLKINVAVVCFIIMTIVVCAGRARMQREGFHIFQVQNDMCKWRWAGSHDGCTTC